LPPTQIGRALNELGIVWKAAHSPQAKGRIERSFGTAQDRLVKGLRLAGANSLEEANAYLQKRFLPWWNKTLRRVPENADDAHRPLEKEHDLASALSQVETRQVGNDYTIRFEGKIYQIVRAEVRPGLRGGTVRVERRLEGTVAVRFGPHWLQIRACEPRPKVEPVKVDNPPERRYGKPRQPSEAMRRSMHNLLGGPKESIRNAGPKQPAVFRVDQPKASARKLHPRMQAKKHPSARGSLRGVLLPILRSQPRRIGLGHPLGRDPWRMYSR
jgi:hypothetical protein